MADYVDLTIIEEEFYCRHFELDGDCLNGTHVHLFTECGKNLSDRGDGKYYTMDLFLSVGDHAAREHLIGVCFGDGPMSQEKIDQVILEFIKTQLNDLLPVRVAWYGKKEELMELWLKDATEH